MALSAYHIYQPVSAYHIWQPDEFYEKLDGLFRDLGVPDSVHARSLLTIQQCVGLGYAQSTTEELEFLIEVRMHRLT